MKKVLRFLILTLLILRLVFPLSVGAAVTDTELVLIGDIDENGVVNSLDVQFVLRASVNLEKLDALQKNAADINRDGVVTAADARLILRSSVDFDKPEQPSEEFSEEASETTNRRIDGYTVERDQFLEYGGEEKFFFFDIVHFSGDPTITDPINQGIMEIRNDYEENVVKMEVDTPSHYLDSNLYSILTFEPHTLESVYYDDRYVSVGWSWDWYAGGIGNHGWKGYNIDLQTMKPMTIEDILGENATEIMEQAVVDDPNFSLSSVNMFFGGFEHAQFYFDKQNVYVGMGGYNTVFLTIPR